MAGAKCRLCRREGEKLFLKGERCYSPKCPVERKRAFPPGQHGPKGGRRLSDYGRQLREKQKAKRTYGITERTLKKYYKEASLFKGETGKRLLQLLETRLDNVLFRSGLLGSRSLARQIINHGSCIVDGKKVDIPSYQVRPNQILTLTTKGLTMEAVKKALAQKTAPLPWLDKKAVVVKVIRLPERKEMESSLDEQFITEFYSR
jgi:small subunit ribosomal protein S4